MAAEGRTWDAIPEELDPCPCRHTPTPEPTPEAPVETLAGTNDGVLQEIIDQVAEAEAQAIISETPLEDAKPLFMDPIIDVPDEKPVSALGMGTTSSGTVPVYAEKPVEEDPTVVQQYTLILPTRDVMQLSPPLEVGNANGLGDNEMAESRQAETFMGKEACGNEDEAEAAVDLDGDEAVQLDARTDSQLQDTTLAQMEANSNQAGNVLMPEVQ